jgi:hypothetical protein
MLVFWICLCAFLNCIGWLLSAIHQLNRAGYLAATALALAIWAVFQIKQGRSLIPNIRLRVRWRRFRSGFPLLFLSLAGLAILGGILHAPGNYDGLAYRIPRMLHWMAEGQWHWVYTEFPRLNTRATGFEWVNMPLLIFTKTDRFMFLTNAVNYLFMPGLFFSVLTGMGVRRRVAATWMWLLPTGYCYVLQAGSIGNDLMGGFYVLAAMRFALRAGQNKSPVDFWISILAAGLLSSGKTSNLPLLLPWALAIAPAWRVVVRRPVVTAAVCMVAVCASFIPMAVLNHRHLGDWTGFSAEGYDMTRGEPVVRVVNNTVLLTIQNFVPPVFPMSGAWNRWAEKNIPPGFAAKIGTDFERAGAKWVLDEMQIEETAGMGFGISVLLSVSLVAGWLVRGKSFAATRDWSRLLLQVSPWLALVVFMLKSNLSASARLASPYFGLLLPLILALPCHRVLVRCNWWRSLAVLLVLPAFLLLVISPPRPLWPAKTLLTRPMEGEGKSQHPLLRRALTVYSVYGERSDAFKSVREKLPADANPLGYLATDEIETSLWRPFGKRTLLHVKPGDTRAQLSQRGIAFVLVSAETWERLSKKSFESWCGDLDAELLATFRPKLRAGKDPTDWYLIRLRPTTIENPLSPIQSGGRQL